MVEQIKELKRQVMGRELALTELQETFELVEEEYKRQLSAARYAYHKQVQHRYKQDLLSGALDLDRAKDHYAKAMRNYDSIVENAINGSSHQANEADMAKGFE